MCTYAKVREGFELVAQLKEPDQVPVAMLAAGDFISWFSGVPASRSPEYWGEDYHRKMAAQLKVVEAFPDILFWPGIWPDFGPIVEASALGCRIKFLEDSPPRVTEAAVKHVEDVERLEPPDPHRDGLMPKVLEAYRLMIEEVPRTLRESYGYLNGVVVAVGPTDLACQAVGYEALMLTVHHGDQLIGKLMDTTSRTVIDWIEAQGDAAGGLRFIILMEDAVGFFSEDQYMRFFHPYLRRVCEKFRRRDNVILLHSCGETSHLLSVFKDLPVNLLHYGPETDTKLVKQALAGRIALTGGLSPYREIVSRSPEAVLKACREAIRLGGIGGGFALSVSGSLPVGTSSENLMAVVKAAEVFGKYPLQL